MADRKLEELAADIDDAFTDVEELEANSGEKLKDLRKTLEHASETIDEIGDEDEKE
jgi:hypothetical protein